MLELAGCNQTIQTYVPLSFENEGAATTVAKEAILIDCQFAYSLDVGDILNVVTIHGDFIGM